MADDEENPETYTVIAICETDGCPSNGREIPLVVSDAVYAVMCGACGNEIENVNRPEKE